MNLKKKIREFFTLTRTGNGGFTLVELIVVIAILAILAGVAVPIYSGYIKKAEQAGDQQLMGALNTAFSAAAIENGKTVAELTGSTLTIANGLVTGLDTSTATGTVSVMAMRTVAEDPVFTSFKKFFAGNIDTPFKTIENATLISGVNGFEVPKDGASAANKFADAMNKVKEAVQESINKLNNSGFGTIGADALMQKVDTVTGLANSLMNDFNNTTLENALASTLADLPAMLGVDEDTAETIMYEMMMERAKEINPENPDAALNQARNEIASNFAVLYTAKAQMEDIKNGNATTQSLLADLQSGMSSDDIIDLLKGTDDADTTREGITKTAMLYAMYTSYANNLPEGENRDKALASAANPTLFASALTNDTNFQTYLLNGDGQAAKDLEGYLGALDIINQSAQGNSDAVQDLLLNGYNDPDLVAALQDLLAQQ